MFNLKVCACFAFIIACCNNIFNIETAASEAIGATCGGHINRSLFTKIGPKYYYIPESMVGNWFQAAHYCRMLGVDLATIESEAEWHALSEHILAKDYASPQLFWLAYNDLGKEGTFYSIATGKPMMYAKWAPAQPDNRESNEHCVSLLLDTETITFKMNDVPCNLTQRYICELPAIAK